MRPELSQAIDLLRSDSPGSIERAIELLQDTVYSFSMTVCGHREDAEDTMQEVLYRSLRHLARIDEPRAGGMALHGNQKPLPEDAAESVREPNFRWTN